jgi:hypothetical protein
VTTRAVLGDGTSLSVAQERDLVLEMCAALLLHLGGEVKLHREICARAVEGYRVEWDLADEDGYIRAYLKPKEA